MKHILITGGAGFIGSHLALALERKGYAVTVLDNLSPQIHGIEPDQTSPLFRSIQGKVHFIKGDVTIHEDWEEALRGQDIVVHLAAETGTGQSMYEIERYTRVNVGGTALLLNILTNQMHHIQKVVVASSRAIYGEGKYNSQKMGFVYPLQRSAEDMDKGDFEVKYEGCKEVLQLLPTDESSKIHPSSVYGITKQNQEQMVMLVCKAIGIAGVALRYQNVYGPGQSLHNPYTGILSIFSTQIRNGKGINIFEDGKESRDFVFIDDVVEATILSIENDQANHEIFNVGTGIPTDVLSVANLLVKNFGVETSIEITGNYRIGDIRHNYADLTKIRSILNFEPKVDFKTGISYFSDWVSNQEIVEDRYAESIMKLKEKGLYK